MDLMITDRTKTVPAKASAAMEILKDVRLRFDRATPKTATTTLRAIKNGTAPSSHSATALPQCSMNSEATASSRETDFNPQSRGTFLQRNSQRNVRRPSRLVRLHRSKQPRAPPAASCQNMADYPEGAAFVRQVTEGISLPLRIQQALAA